MKLLSTFSRLDPDPMLAELDPDTFRLKFTEVTGQYSGTAVEMPRVEIMFVFHTDTQGLKQGLELILAASFDAPSAEFLKAHFPELDAFAHGHPSYCFRLKQDALARYSPDWAQSVALPLWLGTGDGALLNLENYELIGYYEFS